MARQGERRKPGSVGIPNVEAGIFQTFHPADDKHGATFAQLRTGCTGSTLTNPNAVNRELQIRSGLNFVRAKRDIARMHLFNVGARWDESSSDFWTMVKQEHALPCVPVELLPRVAARLGRPPATWDEFRTAVMAMPASEMGPGCQRFANSPSKHGLRNRLEDTLRNAEEVGKFGGGVLGTIGGLTRGLGTYGPILLIGAAGALLFLLWRE